jgi:hypothetical protein
MAWYLRLFRDWDPQKTVTPTLFVIPSEPIPIPSPTLPDHQPWHSSWPLQHTLSQVPGNHATMIATHATELAKAVDEWLTTAVTIRKASS